MKNYSVDDKLCALSLMLALCAIVIFTAALCVSSNNEGALPAAAGKACAGSSAGTVSA